MRRSSVIFTSLVLAPIFTLSIFAQQADQNTLLRFIQSWHVDAGGDLNGDNQTDILDLLLKVICVELRCANPTYDLSLIPSRPKS